MSRDPGILAQNVKAESLGLGPAYVRIQQVPGCTFDERILPLTVSPESLWIL